MNIINKLFESDFSGCHKPYHNDSEYAMLFKSYADIYDRIYSELDKSHKHLLEELYETSCDLCDIREKQIFSYGFKIGAEIILEITKIEK